MDLQHEKDSGAEEREKPAPDGMPDRQRKDGEVIDILTKLVQLIFEKERMSPGEFGMGYCRLIERLKDLLRGDIARQRRLRNLLFALNSVRSESVPECPVCGKLLTEDSSFCSNCGRSLHPISPASGPQVHYRTLPPMFDDREELRSAQQTPPAAAQAPTPAPELAMKEVEFSALAPKTFVKDDYTVIHVVMYEEAFRHVVDELCREMDSPSQEARSGLQRVKEGSEIRVVLSSPSPGIEIDDNEATQTWQGKYLNFSFGVFVPQEYKRRNALFTAAVYVNDVIATKLNFAVKCSSLFEQKIAVSREDVLSAFVSYASQDRGRVAAIIQGMKKARPDLDVFFDVESLRSGENWQEALYREIERRDILFLCWSHFARDSQWVDAEWRYAYTQKGAEGVEPIPIEPPDQCPPPEELSNKHFNDRLLHYMEEES